MGQVKCKYHEQIIELNSEEDSYEEMMQYQVIQEAAEICAANDEMFGLLCRKIFEAQ